MHKLLSTGDDLKVSEFGTPLRSLSTACKTAHRTMLSSKLMSIKIYWQIEPWEIRGHNPTQMFLAEPEVQTLQIFGIYLHSNSSPVPNLDKNVTLGIIDLDPHPQMWNQSHLRICWQSRIMIMQKFHEIPSRYIYRFTRTRSEWLSIFEWSTGQTWVLCWSNTRLRSWSNLVQNTFRVLEHSFTWE